jgi:hypothetical protein
VVTTVAAFFEDFQKGPTRTDLPKPRARAGEAPLEGLTRSHVQELCGIGAASLLLRTTSSTQQVTPHTPPTRRSLTASSEKATTQVPAMRRLFVSSGALESLQPEADEAKWDPSRIPTPFTCLSVPSTARWRRTARREEKGVFRRRPN